MTGYLVEMRTTMREVYYVEANSAEEAKRDWADGEVQIQEAIDSEFYDIREEEA